ncbi:MAG: leucine-rich repeat protein [Clostridia bacterium]|nr:leucine-rich repeat protein [Clostridia bacterium]
MKHTKHLLTVLLMALLCAVLVLAVSAEGDAKIVASGNCGENVIWTLDSEGTLTASGNGEMNASVLSNDDRVVSFVVGEGITGGINHSWPNLQQFVVSPENPNYSSDENGCLLNKAGDTLVCYPAGRTAESFEIPSYITTIGDGSSVFSGCEFLKKLIIPNTVKRFNAWKYLVGNCDALETIVINTTAQIVRPQEFSLMDITNNVKVWSFGEAFTDLSTLGGNSTETIGYGERITVDEDNPVFSSKDGVLFNKDKTILLRYPAANPRKEYIVPLTVKKIGYRAFFSCFSMEKLILPEGLQEIDQEGIEHTFISNLVLPTSLKKLSFAAIVENYFLNGIVDIRSMDLEFAEFALGSTLILKNISKQIFNSISAYRSTDPVPEDLQPYLAPYSVETDGFILQRIYPEYIEWYDGEHLLLAATIRCHAGSTAEAYAIEHGMDYELVHFYEGEWNYDWDNLVRWRKCIHCDERETEPLETETSGVVEIVAPADDETGFDVQPVSTDYVLIKEALGEMNVVKAFGITLKNHDGVHVQPKGTVKVKLPNDFKSESYKVYRVNADGTYTDMNAFREGSHLVFYTDHFSLYVIVDESTPAVPDEPETPTAPEDSAKPASRTDFLSKLFAWLIELFHMFTRWIQK